MEVGQKKNEMVPGPALGTMRDAGPGRCRWGPIPSDYWQMSTRQGDAKAPARSNHSPERKYYHHYSTIFYLCKKRPPVPIKEEGRSCSAVWGDRVNSSHDVSVTLQGTGASWAESLPWETQLSNERTTTGRANIVHINLLVDTNMLFGLVHYVSCLNFPSAMHLSTD